MISAFVDLSRYIRVPLLPFSYRRQFDADAECATVAVDSIPEEWMGLDVGPKTVATFKEALEPCNTIVRGVKKECTTTIQVNGKTVQV